MEALGINLTLLFMQFIVIIVLVALPILSLIDLAKRGLRGTPLALWALMICAIPVIGSLAYWIIKPTAESNA